MMLIVTVFSCFLACSFCATDFCQEPLGMKRGIILNEQIKESSVYMNRDSHKGYRARLDNNWCWCSLTGSDTNQWVEVDLRFPASITGIKIQGDPNHSPNYIKTFKLRYSTDKTHYLYKKDVAHIVKEFNGANGESQTITKMFPTESFVGRYVEFRPITYAGLDVCVRFELYGCAHVCNNGLGIESGSSLPSSITITASTEKAGNQAFKARLSDVSTSWCASIDDLNQYLQIDFGKVVTLTGVALQGNPTASSWVKQFYFDYGMALESLATYQEHGSNKLFVGNEDQNTKVVNWFKVRLSGRYVRIKPAQWDTNICMRLEIIGCNLETLYELGAENRVLSNSRFNASGHTEWIGGRYLAHDGRLNNDYPWGVFVDTDSNPWFKVDLGRVMLVNGISTQGDGTYADNFYPDFRLKYSMEVSPAIGSLIHIKGEDSTVVRVFPGNTNSAGVKFNLLANPVSTRHLLFEKNTSSKKDYTLRVEIYGMPQVCTKSFGMMAGSKSTNNPSVSVSSGTVPALQAKLNSPVAWCATTQDTNQYFQYDFGGIRSISGFAIQGNPTDLKWIKTFKVQYKEKQSDGFITYQDSGSDKAFVGCSSRNLIVYHWFSSNLRMGYLRIVPQTWEIEICLRMDVYGCHEDDCFNELGLQSSSKITDASISASTYVTSHEPNKGRFNAESVWTACQVGACSSKEVSGNKPWIQVCLSALHTIRSVIIQGPGNADNVASVTEFSLKFALSSSSSFQTYNLDGAVKKFAVSIGRYSSSQIDLPFPIISKCLRLQVDSQKSALQNVGLRWELLGCTTIPQVSTVTITPSSPSVAKGGELTLTCTAHAYPGFLSLNWKNETNVISTKDIYEVGSVTVSNDARTYHVSSTLKLTATESYVATAFQTCSVTDQSQGLVQCKHTYDCSASYDSLPSSLKSSPIEVTVTGLQGKPEAPTGITNTSRTNTSVTVSWNPSASVFPIKDYRAVLKKDGTVIQVNSQFQATSTSFTKLSPSTKYVIEVSAQSTMDVFSNSGTLVFTTDEGVAKAPVSVTASALSSTSIQLSWSPPSIINGILYDFKFRYKLASHANFSESKSVGKNMVEAISGLKPFSVYEFQVQASTKGGSILGEWSDTVSGKTLEGRPSEPRNLRVVAPESRLITIEWMKPEYENGIVGNYTVRFNGSKSYNTSFAHFGSKTIPYNATLEYTRVIIDSLTPGTDYLFEVAATTGVGSGVFSSVAIAKTLFEAAPVPSLRYRSGPDGTVNVLCEAASDINGPVTEYRLYIVNGNLCSQNGTFDTIPVSRVPLDLAIKEGLKQIQGTTLELSTVGNYSFCYYAVIKDKTTALISEAASFFIVRKTLETKDIKIYMSEIQANSFVIPMSEGLSNTKYYQVVVMEGNTSSKSPNDWKPTELGPYDAMTHKPGKPYITASFSKFVPKFPVGDGREYSKSRRKRRNIGSVTYYNVPLRAGTEYLVFTRAHVSESEFFSSHWMGPIATKTSIPIITDPPTNWGMIAGIVVSIFVLIFMTAVIVIYKRRYRQGIGSEGKEPMKMEELANSAAIDNISYENNGDEDVETDKATKPVPAPRGHSILERKRSAASSLRRKKPPRTVGTDTRHSPVSVQDFASHSKELQRDSHHGITLEFEDLIKGQQYSWDAAMNTDNKPKNRYANIAAYDHSRAKLNPIHGVPHSDYFNANHIHGYSKANVYIASQGPVESGTNDFWRLLWDKHVPAIVMVTNLFERGKVKCAQYWPDIGTVQYGAITVTLASVDNYVDYTIRCFTVTREGFKEQRTIYQYHFTTWPDHGIPESPTDLLNLRRKLRKNFPYDIEEPILVHCSAGVGRTGTFIVIDAMLELAKSQRKVDIFNYLNYIRSQRIHLIQVEEQYIFVYKAILEAVTCGVTEIETQDLRIKINQLSMKEKSGETGFEKQFKRLTLVTPIFNEKETPSGLSKTNAPKNRVANLVPREGNRVMLQQSIYENDGGTDYINAIYVNGYKRKNAFIATQHPLPDTINDFWTMIYQENVATIVLLNRLKDGSENLPIFWPNVQHESVFGSIIVANTVEDGSSDSVERLFAVRHAQSNEDYREVKMFHFESWPDHGAPKQFNKLLMLLSRIERCQQQQGQEHPLVVMCRDGAGRTGSFIAITLVLERFKTEQLVDVFQTIKKLRAFRPQFVENVVQYKFCHTLTQAYMESFDDYANFNG